jgi:hypothetical protein
MEKVRLFVLPFCAGIRRMRDQNDAEKVERKEGGGRKKVWNGIEASGGEGKLM